MGCTVCNNKAIDKYSIENILSDEYKQTAIVSKHKISDYVRKVFCLINKIRTNPKQFIPYVEESKKYIKEVDGKLIFDNKLKVSLYKGASVFDECINYLNNLSPMNELKFKDDIVLECPKEPDKIKDLEYFKDRVRELRDKSSISAFFKDALREPDISVLLMIVDDAERNQGKKRAAVLNPEFKYIGISSSDSDECNNDNKDNVDNKENKDNKKNGPFCAYFSFSK